MRGLHPERAPDRAASGRRGRRRRPQPGSRARPRARRRRPPPQASCQRPLPPGAQIGEQPIERRRVNAVAERLRRFLVEKVRLVHHHVLERRQRLAAREEEGMVDADEVGGVGAGAREAPVAVAPRGAVPAEAGRARRAQLAGQSRQRRQLQGGAVGQSREIDVAAPRSSHKIGERERAVDVGQGLALRSDGFLEPSPAEVVLAAHEERPAPALRAASSRRGAVRGPRVGAAGPWSWC